jgi:hypothetical protein
VPGVAVGGVVAHAVGDFGHNYIADFGEQREERGALGIITGFGAAGEDTGNDTRHLVSDVGHLASGAWQTVTSWF